MRRTCLLICLITLCAKPTLRNIPTIDVHIYVSFLLSLYNRRRFLGFLLVFKIVHRLQCPEQLTDYLQLRSSLHSRSLRDNTLLHLLKVKTSIGQSTFQYSAAADWNSLPRSIREITSLARFKSKLYNYLHNLDHATHRCLCN